MQTQAKTYALPNMLSLSSTSMIVILIALLSTMIFSGNAKADNRYQRYEAIRPTMHQNFQYIYYPAEQVYYAPHSRLWYWNRGNRWQSAYYAPAYLNVNFRVGGIPIQLQSALPYQEHAYVVRQYDYAWNKDRRPYPHYAKEKYYRKYESHRHHNRRDD